MIWDQFRHVIVNYVCIGVAVLILLSGSASATTVNIVRLQADTCAPDAFLEEGSENRISANINDGGLDCTYTVDGHAGLGMVGVRATHSKTGNPFLESTIASTSATTEFQITAPQGFAGLIPISVNAALDGLVTASRNTRTGARSSLVADVSLSQNFQDYGTARVKLVANAGFLISTDSLSEQDQFDGRLSTTEIMVDPNLPVSLSFDLRGTTTFPGAVDPGTIKTAFVDAFNTLSFDASGPAFNLPDGFSVTSTALNVFGNQWIDARVQDPGVSEVPLPASVLLLMTGLWFLRVPRRCSERRTL